MSDALPPPPPAEPGSHPEPLAGSTQDPAVPAWPAPLASSVWPPPPPPPPPAPRARFSVRRRGAALLTLAGLVAGSAVAGFFITKAVAPPAATPTAANGATATAPWPPGRPFKGHGFAGRIAGIDLLQDAAKSIGVTEQQLITDLRSGQSVSQVATAHGKTAQEVINVLVGDLTTAINSAQSSGKITASQATALKSHLTQMVTAFVDSTRPPGIAIRAGGEQVALQAAAKAIGVTAQQLASDIRGGQSIASVATAHKVATSAVESQVTSAVDKAIQSLEKSGRISASEAGQLTAQVSQRVDAWVTGTLPGWPFGPFGGAARGGPMMPAGPWGPHPSAPSSSAAS
jgi:hypothetical protein